MMWLRFGCSIAGVVHTASCSGGLVRNLQCDADISFGIVGLEMIGFTCGAGCSAADGLEMVHFIGEIGCSAADSLEIVHFIGEISCSAADGLEMDNFIHELGF